MSTKQLRQAITPTHILGSTGVAEGSDLGYQSKAAFVLGTVSQSGGVPTGAIIERGSNANGEYVRYADGTQICWGTVNFTLPITNVTGSGFQANDLQQWTYPASFVSTIGLSLSVFPRYVSGDSRSWYTGQTKSTTLMDVIGHSFISHTPNVQLDIVAIGRWF